MMRYLVLLVAASLLVCQAAGMEPAQTDEDDDFDNPYQVGGTHDFDLNGILDNNLQRLHSAVKREESDRQREIELAAQQRFYPYGRRTDQPGYIQFGKRGQYFIPMQYQKRELAEVNPYSVAKRDAELTGLEDDLAASKRANPYSLSGLGSLSFGKRGDLFRSYAFGKRALGSSFAFGKRGLSSFTFGKRGLPEVDRFADDSALMRDDKRALGSSFSFGKRAGGLSSFAFGKRAGER